MPSLSEHASVILGHMEPDRRYEPQDLQSLVTDLSPDISPDISNERLREIMHELWINRQVERVGYSGWRRHRSAPRDLPDPRSREVQAVKPEDLFDHDTFGDFFK